MLISWLTGRRDKNTKRPGARRRQPPRFRPCLEAFEDRLLLAGDFRWTGAVSELWNNAANWTRTAGTGTWPGAPGSFSDRADFVGSPPHNCKLNTHVSLSGLRLTNNFTGVLLIQTGLFVNVRGFGFVMDGGTLNFEQNASLTLEVALLNRWSGGAINTTANNGFIYVCYDGELDITQDAQYMGTSLIIGRNPQGENTRGTVRLGQQNMASNLALYNDSNIRVWSQGVLELNQSANSDTLGGILMAGGFTNSRIDNFGTIRRTVADGANQTLQIDVPARGLSTTAVLEVANNCRVNFVRQYVQEAGNLKTGGNRAHVGGFALPGGKISIEDPGAAGLHDTYFEGGLVADGGVIEFAQTTAGAYVRMNVMGNLLMGAGLTIDNFHLGSGTLSDRFVVSGSVNVGGWLNYVLAPGFVGGQPITVIDKTTSGNIDGNFANLPPDTYLGLGTWLYQVRYNRDGNNDLVLFPIVNGQHASCVVNVSSEFNVSPGTYSAAQALNDPNTFSYGDGPTAWSPAVQNGSQEYITLCFPNNVYAQGVTVREINGNGFVTQVDLLDTNDVLHPIWSGTDPSQPGSPAELTLSFGAVNFLVKGVKVYVNTNHNLNTFEQIDAVTLYGEDRGGLAPLSGGTGLAGALASLRVSSLARPNVGPFATFAVSGPVALGVPITFLFSNPRGGSGYRYSFDFNNDGDFSDPGERADGTSPSAQHTFTTRGWHVVRGRIRSADGRFTDFWVRVFIP